MQRTLFLATLGLSALASGPAFAMAPENLVVHVPFAFTVSSVTLPAGDYRVGPLNDFDNNVLEVRSFDGRHTAMVLTTDAAREGRGASPQLVFDHYGKKEFLRAVELPDEAGASLPSTAAEIETARHLGTAHEARHRTGS
jgi:hypothetical protein